jgi:DNA-binding CsgD family transcriptional regulator
MEIASISGAPAAIYRSRLSVTQYIRSVIVDLKIAFGGTSPQHSFGSSIKRDHPDRFFILVLANGSSYTCRPSASSKPNSFFKWAVEMIREELGLSQRQALITSLLADGESLASIAADNGMTLSTARWHLREIFKRTKCHSQAELIDLTKKVCFSQMRADGYT